MCHIENVVRSKVPNHFFFFSSTLCLLSVGDIFEGSWEESEIIKDIWHLINSPCLMTLPFLIVFFAEKCVNSHKTFSVGWELASERRWWWTCFDFLWGCICPVSSQVPTFSSGQWCSVLYVVLIADPLKCKSNYSLCLHQESLVRADVAIFAKSSVQMQNLIKTQHIITQKYTTWFLLL